ncbi:hypothetical protein [Salsipaludibacter albus]|uniref:hypothetical protein n=1 Tax=Salsipaludibacter albus TaxID=2849650 RepID=UPI001EE3B466|nr:hypothetical protein [Salsipaludibacter albus]MBY5162202.1 hypothetical protein [Salsipaludibacter albus]
MSRGVAWAIAIPIGLALGLALDDLVLGVPFVIAFATAFGGFRGLGASSDEPDGPSRGDG